jgi:hypothetical protein
MKVNYTYWLLATALLPLVFSCSETKKETTGEQKDTLAEVKETQPSALAHYGTRLQQIVKSDEGVLRGINFGDDKEKVKSIENATAVEDTTDHIGYRVELGDYEDLDVRYHLNKNQQVWGFTLDIYLNQQSSVDSLFNDFKDYFTEQFGPGSFDNHHNMVAWNLSDSLKTIVKDVSVKQAPGLQIQIMDYKLAK